MRRIRKCGGKAEEGRKEEKRQGRGKEKFLKGERKRRNEKKRN